MLTTFSQTLFAPVMVFAAYWPATLLLAVLLVIGVVRAPEKIPARLIFRPLLLPLGLATFSALLQPLSRDLPSSFYLSFLLFPVVALVWGVSAVVRVAGGRLFLAGYHLTLVIWLGAMTFVAPMAITGRWL